MDGHTGEHPRIGAVDVIPFVPLGGRPRWTTASSSPATSASGSPTRFELPVFLYADAALRPDRVKLADVRRGQYEGLKAEIDRARPRAGLRPGPDAPVGRGGRRRGQAVPHRLQHQPRLRATSTWPSGSPGGSASPAAACPRSRRTASGSRSCGGAQVSMNVLDFETTPLWRGLGDRPRGRRRGRRRARRIGADRARAAGLVPRRRRPCRARPATRRSSAGSRPPPSSSACATSRRSRRSSCGSRPPAPGATESAAGDR